MSIYKELSYENYIEQVKGIRFCILSPNEIKRMSVAEITKTDTYIGTDPVINGLFDPRMGVLDHNKVCHTCEQKNTFCPGHFGHIHLAKPVFYIQFFDTVRKILKCVCWRCSKLLVDIDSPQVKAILSKKYSRQKRWEMMYKLCSKVKRCGQETLDGCKAKQPDKVYREPIVKVVMEWKDLDTDKEELKKQVLNAEEILRILQRITDDDAEALGFHRKYNRPEWMICTVLPVPPPAVRPSVRTDTGLRSEDDLTHKLCDIVKNNNTLKAKIEKGASKEQVDIASQVLQYHVATFIDNNIPGINPAQQRTGRLLKSLTERLKSKEGRIRGNLMGKRVDFSARSVITPDPNISIDELGVPLKIAMNLTFPEVVNRYNKEKLTNLVRNGPDVYPGAKCLRHGGRTFLLKNKDRASIELKEGDVVERHMMNGDYVLFNRQPSLHRMSMMGHRVVVMPYNTFRSNPSVCPCFNSDYDGDEMNAHLPQSVVTMNELVELAAVPTQIISPRECKPIIAIVQDVPLGVYRLTKSNVFIDHKQLMNLMSLNPRYLGYVPSPSNSTGSVDKWSGRQVLSTIIPKNINLRAGNKSYDGPTDKENFVVIENGEIKQGIVDKLIYQNRTRGLIHSIYNECGPDETRMFFDNTQRIICDWLVTNGFSVGISDLIVDNDTQDNLKKTIHDMKVKVYDIISQVHMGNLDNRSISNNNDYFEGQVNKILNQASSDAGNHGLSKINDATNRMINMIKSGSKGNVINVAQMISCLGQVNVEGKRIAYGFENRTLPHYTKYDDGPESRGFVESSFIKGLNPQEFFFHSMGGREGLIDTAVKTSETGYLQRKLVKAMEDCKIGYDHTVRNASGCIVQFLYGEDGMDPTKIESQSLPYIELDYSQLRDKYLITHVDVDNEIASSVTDAVMVELKKDRGWEQKMKEHFEQVLADREFMIADIFKGRLESSIMYPVSFQRIITNAQSMFKGAGTTDLSPIHVLEEVDRLCEGVYITKWNKGNRFFQILARAFLSPKRVLLEYRFDRNTFDFVIQQIKHRFYDAIAHPSEMVGVISAQSIGEPATQMTLNSVEWNTEVLVDMDGKLERVKIGEFIDNQLDVIDKENIEDHPNDTKLGWIKEKAFKILSCDEEGKVDWKLIEAVTKHPPINEDGSHTLVKVVTKTGRDVIATKAKSFLKRENNKIVPVKGEDLQVGDFVPVSSTLPVKGLKEIWENTNFQSMALDKTTGFFIGAYLAEGCCTKHHVLISNIDDKSHAKIQEFCARHTLNYHVSEHHNNKGQSKTIHIHSVALASLLAGAFGTRAHEKRIPADLLGGNDEFCKAMVNAYMPGDGCADDELSVTSLSNGLLQDIQQVLTKYGVQSTIQTAQKMELQLNAHNTHIFKSAFKLTKQECPPTSLSASDIIPNVATTEHGVISIPRARISDYIKNSKAREDKAVYEQLLQENVFYDEIISITEVLSEHPYVYDLTIKDTRNFNIYNGLCMRDTFHLSGVSSASKAVRGVPRMKELLSVTKNIKAPSLTIHLDKSIRKEKNEGKKVLNTIQTTFFKDIVKHCQMYFDPDDFNTTVEEDRLFLATYKEFIREELMETSQLTPWLLRFEFDKEKMKENEITMMDLGAVLNDFYKDTVNCMFSDDSSNNLVMRVKLPESKGGDKDIVTELKALEKNIMENIIINGVKGINKVVMNNREFKEYDATTLTFEKTNEWVLETNGTNLIDILGHKIVDNSRTISNDVTEIYEVLGIEAARQALYNEISDIIKDADLYVNYRHISLLVDTMTNKGYLLSVDRHGINRVDIGPLAKCSFEEVTDMLVKAGIFSEVDKISGVSANIMLGQIPPYGTGETDILIDDRKLAELSSIVEEEDELEEDSYIVAVGPKVLDTVCDISNMGMYFQLPAKDDTIGKLDVNVSVN